MDMSATDPNACKISVSPYLVNADACNRCYGIGTRSTLVSLQVVGTFILRVYLSLTTADSQVDLQVP